VIRRVDQDHKEEREKKRGKEKQKEIKDNSQITKSSGSKDIKTENKGVVTPTNNATNKVNKAFRKLSFKSHIQGVDRASQERYVGYFQTLVRLGRVPDVTRRIIVSIGIKGIATLCPNPQQMWYRISEGVNVLHTSDQDKIDYHEKENRAQFFPVKPVVVGGDIRIDFYTVKPRNEVPMVKGCLLWYWFHSSFTDPRSFVIENAQVDLGKEANRVRRDISIRVETNFG